MILDRAESTIFQLAEDRVRVGLIGVKDLVRENFERLEKIFSEGRRITGLATGYSGLDNETAGLQPSELIILAARPSMGKTALALNIAENVVLRQKEPVAIFSLEMSKESLLLRLLASEARVDAHKFRTGHMNKDDWGKITGSLATLGEAPLWIDDSASSTVLEMGAKARRLKRDRGLSLVIVDYLQLVVPTNTGRGSNRQEEVSSISRSLKGPGQGIEGAHTRAQPVDARARTRRAQTATFRLARIGRDRTGCGRGSFHQSPQFLQNRYARRRSRQGRTDHRQAAQRSHRQPEFCVPRPSHPLRRSRPGHLELRRRVGLGLMRSVRFCSAFARSGCVDGRNSNSERKLTDLNPQAKQMADESMVRTLDAQARAIWPQEVELFRRYSLPSEARILDAGCGTGEISSRLAETLSTVARARCGHR